MVRWYCTVLAIVVTGGAVAETSGDPLLCVRAYADTMIEHGRDVYGRDNTPLFAAALDRRKGSLLEGSALEAVVAMPHEAWGIRPHDRTLSGANPMHDENLYQILYALSKLTGEAKYKQAADDALAWFFTHCQSPATGLMTWGEHIGWDFRTEARIDKNAMNTHEYFRPWVLWDASYRLAPQASESFALGVWEHQIGDHETGNFSRHAQWDAHGPGLNSEYPRHGGFYIATWAHAYAATGDEVYLKAITTLVRYFDSRRHPDSQALPSESAERSKGTLMWPSSNVSLAVDLETAAKKVPKDLAATLRTSAATTDEVYLRLPHEPGPGGRGFVTLADTATLGNEQADYARMWATGYGDSTNAQVAALVSLRFKQTQDTRYRAMVLSCADAYLASQPDISIHLYPGTFGDVIWLFLDAYEMTNESKYLSGARAMTSQAAAIFLSNGPLPRASSKVDHYEAITRGDTLMMAMLRFALVEQSRGDGIALVYTDR